MNIDELIPDRTTNVEQSISRNYLGEKSDVQARQDGKGKIEDSHTKHQFSFFLFPSDLRRTIEKYIPVNQSRYQGGQCQLEQMNDHLSMLPYPPQGTYHLATICIKMHQSTRQ
jgi:hypothetical protein